MSAVSVGTHFTYWINKHAFTVCTWQQRLVSDIIYIVMFSCCCSNRTSNFVSVVICVPTVSGSCPPCSSWFNASSTRGTTAWSRMSMFIMSRSSSESNDMDKLDSLNSAVVLGNSVFVLIFGHQFFAIQQLSSTDCFCFSKTILWLNYITLSPSRQDNTLYGVGFHASCILARPMRWLRKNTLDPIPMPWSLSFVSCLSRMYCSVSIATDSL